MHDLLREYAAGRLESLGQVEVEPGLTEAGATRLAHVAYWHQYLAGLELLGADDWQDLEAHRPEVEGAADWLLGDWGQVPELAAGMAVEISQAFEWYALARWEEWVKAGLEAAEACGQRNVARILQRSLGSYLWHGGEIARAEHLLEASLATARELLAAATTDEETEAGQRGVAVTLGDIARLKAQAGDVAAALDLHQQELEVYETLGDVRSRAVTQSDLADLRVSQGEYAEAERLYRNSLEICQQIGDAPSTFALLARLGELALARGRPQEALPLLQEARRGFETLGFAPWVAHLDALLAQVEEPALSLDDLLSMVRAARQGDPQAGESARQIFRALDQAQEGGLADLGRALEQVLAGLPPEAALAGLPDDLRARVLEGLTD